MRHHGLHALVTHLERVLQDHAIELLVAHGGDECFARIEPDEPDLARLANVLQREQHAGRGRFIGREDTFHLVAEAIDEEHAQMIAEYDATTQGELAV